MIYGEIIGDREAILKFKNFTPKLRLQIIQSTQRNTAMMIKYVMEEKLSGQVLKNRTGTGRRSINSGGELAYDEGDYIYGKVGTNKRYMLAHEYGFQGTVTVKEHTRMQTMAWGKPMDPKEVTVLSHPMEMNIPERSFLRSSLEDKRADIIQEYRDAVSRTINE
jgi:phage gpG-like protein